MKKHSKTQAFGSSGRISHDSSGFYKSKMYANLSAEKSNFTQQVQQNTESNPECELPRQFHNKIFNKSAVKMQELPASSVHLMITSPPYNVAKEYDNDLSLREYLDFLQQVFAECYRVLVNGGRACVNIANVGRKPYIPLADYVAQVMLNLGFKMRGEIIWNKGSSAGVSTAWGSWQSASNPTLRDIHEYILVFSKGEYKREKAGRVNSISRENFIEWTKSIWNIDTASAKKIGHPAPFPVELPYRLIELYSFVGDIVLDPFLGSGTTAIAAIEAERKFVGYEISSEYVELAEKRISKYHAEKSAHNL